MQGLRTQEGEKFERFFEIVQKEAKKSGAVLFVDCGLGRVFENKNIECENLCGWLIPVGKVSAFEPLFMGNAIEQHRFDDFYCAVDFEVTGDTIKVVIS